MSKSHVRSTPRVAPASPLVPHSWPARKWPESVHPGEINAARWIVRSFRNELVAAGALARVGKCLVVIGPRYVRWLEGKTLNVGDFQSNNPRMRMPPVGADGGAL
jgi:hypothetical protein